MIGVTSIEANIVSVTITYFIILITYTIDLLNFVTITFYSTTFRIHYTYRFILYFLVIVKTNNTAIAIAIEIVIDITFIHDDNFTMYTNAIPLSSLYEYHVLWSLW